jgi:hypothetical protein
MSRVAIGYDGFGLNTKAADMICEAFNFARTLHIGTLGLRIAPQQLGTRFVAVGGAAQLSCQKDRVRGDDQRDDLMKDADGWVPGFELLHYHRRERSRLAVDTLLCRDSRLSSCRHGTSKHDYFPPPLSSTLKLRYSLEYGQVAFL